MEDSKIVIDWFEKLTGFREESYEGTRQNLYVEGSKLHSKVNGKKYLIGDFQCLSLDKLREETSVIHTEDFFPILNDSLPDSKKLHELENLDQFVHQTLKSKWGFQANDSVYLTICLDEPRKNIETFLLIAQAKQQFIVITLFHFQKILVRHLHGRLIL